MYGCYRISSEKSKKATSLAKQIWILNQRVHSLEDKIDMFRNQLILSDIGTGYIRIGEKKYNYKKIGTKLSDKLSVLCILRYRLEILENELLST